MQRQVRTTPRKRPRQARSRATVDSVLEATARVLVKRGFDGLTTNLVAEAAGVSIGSLYQYFPNKAALVGALIEKHVEDMTSLALSELTRAAQLPMPAAIRSVIEAITHRATLFAPQLLRDPRLVDETCTMVRRYLGVADG